MEKIVYSYGDKVNYKPFIGIFLGGFMLVKSPIYSSQIITIAVAIISLSLLVITVSSMKKEALVIEDRKLIKSSFLFFRTVFKLDDYENYEKGSYTRIDVLFATNKRTQFRTLLIKDHYNKPINSIIASIITILDGSKIEPIKIIAKKPDDEYAYNPDDYIL